MLKLFNVPLFLIFSLISFSQTFNGRTLIWDLVDNPDARLSIKTGTTGINIGGYEGTTLVIKNLSDKKIYISLRQTITDFCGVDVVRNPTFTLMPNETIGGSTFFGGSEQYDFIPSCKERKKYSDDFSTRISSIKMRLTTVKDLQTDIANSNKDRKEIQAPVQEETSYYNIINKPKPKISEPGNISKADVDFWGNKTASPENSNTSSGSVNGTFISDKCTPQRMGIMGNVGADCVPLTFISEKTIQFNSTTNEIRTDDSPDNFILSYKRFDDTVWKEKDVIGNQLKYNLTDLEPCTRYEIKIQRNCGNGARSNPTIPLQLSTVCPGISMIQLNSITETAAKINYRNQLDLHSCSPNKIQKKLVLEYREQKSIKWNTEEFSPGIPPVIYNLKPNTYYVLRARMGYSNNTYSTYSTPITIKTK